LEFIKLIEVALRDLTLIINTNNIDSTYN